MSMNLVELKEKAEAMWDVCGMVFYANYRFGNAHCDEYNVQDISLRLENSLEGISSEEFWEGYNPYGYSIAGPRYQAFFHCQEDGTPLITIEDDSMFHVLLAGNNKIERREEAEVPVILNYRRPRHHELDLTDIREGPPPWEERLGEWTFEGIEEKWGSFYFAFPSGDKPDINKAMKSAQKECGSLWPAVVFAEDENWHITFEADVFFSLLEQVDPEKEGNGMDRETFKGLRMHAEIAELFPENTRLSHPVETCWEDFLFLLSGFGEDPPDCTESENRNGVVGNGYPIEKKASRLIDQLLWAESNQCLQPALEYLKSLRKEEWATSDDSA